MTTTMLPWQYESPNFVREDDILVHEDEILKILSNYGPTNKINNYYKIEYNNQLFTLIIKNITYLGHPHHPHKKRIQVNLQAVQNVDFILGIYKRKNQTYLINFNRDALNNSNSANCSLHFNVLNFIEYHETNKIHFNSIGNSGTVSIYEEHQFEEILKQKIYDDQNSKIPFSFDGYDIKKVQDGFSPLLDPQIFDQMYFDNGYRIPTKFIKPHQLKELLIYLGQFYKLYLKNNNGILHLESIDSILDKILFKIYPDEYTSYPREEVYSLVAQIGNLPILKSHTKKNINNKLYKKILRSSKIPKYSLRRNNNNIEEKYNSLSQFIRSEFEINKSFDYHTFNQMYADYDYDPVKIYRSIDKEHFELYGRNLICGYNVKRTHLANKSSLMISQLFENLIKSRDNLINPEYLPSEIHEFFQRLNLLQGEFINIDHEIKEDELIINVNKKEGLLLSDFIVSCEGIYNKEIYIKYADISQRIFKNKKYFQTKRISNYEF